MSPLTGRRELVAAALALEVRQGGEAVAPPRSLCDADRVGVGRVRPRTIRLDGCEFFGSERSQGTAWREVLITTLERVHG